MTQINRDVARWRPAIHEIRALLELSAQDYPAPVILALIEVESGGDPHARRTTEVTVARDSLQAHRLVTAAVGPITRTETTLSAAVGAQFCGLLQMGELAGLDVGFERRGFRGWDTTAQMLGDGRLALEAFLRYQQRYRSRHDGEPDRLALLWKAGPGTCSRVNALLADGVELDAAIRQAADTLGVPNALAYVRRFRDALRRWNAWVAQQDPVPPVCR